MNVGGEVSPLTLREVIERHGGEIWFEREKASDRSFFRLLIPTAPPQEALEPSILLGRESRPEYYDFDLFRRTEESRALDDRPLTQLTFTVFDTETTGLQPSDGDEIIQIGATRIVNGRLLGTRPSNSWWTRGARWCASRSTSTASPRTYCAASLPLIRCCHSSAGSARKRCSWGTTWPSTCDSCR